MPWLPAVAAIASLAGTGVGIGETLANQPGTPKPPAATATTPTGPTPQQQAQQQAAVSQQLPNIEAGTSGFTNPAYDAMIASLLSGTAGQPGGASAANRAVSQAFGLPGIPTLTPAGATTNAGVPPSPIALSDFTNQYFRAA